MKIITISREFGSGGRELGKRLADLLGFDYYDSEIIYSVARECGMTAGYVERALDEHGWQSFPVTFYGTIGSASYVQASEINLLTQQKKVLEEIAALGKDCVIVGRNADVILREYNPLTIFVCADMDAKVQRCRLRAKEGENFTDRQLRRKIKQIDRMRAKTKAMLSDSEWGQRGEYDLTVNTSRWDIKRLAKAVAEFAESFWGDGE